MKTGLSLWMWRQAFWNRKVNINEGNNMRFQWDKNHLILTLHMIRYDEKIGKVEESSDSSSCVVVDLSSGEKIESMRRMDFSEKWIPDPRGCSEDILSGSIIRYTMMPLGSAVFTIRELNLKIKPLSLKSLTLRPKRCLIFLDSERALRKENFQ